MTDVARVAVESPLPHLDRLFDFAIPQDLAADAQPGCRVRVRFHGRQVGGWLVERGPAQFQGALQPLVRVSGPPVLTPDMAGLCRRVADRYAGVLSDVIRFAVPARVAAVEKAELPGKPGPPAAPGLSAWDGYGLPAEGAASWICHPHDDPFAMLAALAVQTAAAGRGAVLVVPDARDVRALHAACLRLCEPELLAVVSAEASARLRYKTHLQILAGVRRIVIGTRSAVFAPVVDPGLVAVWDDGDGVLAEPQSPGWHAREVAALRAWQSNARLVVGGFTRSVPTAQWVADGTAVGAQLTRQQARERRYRVDALVEPAADRRRIPGRAFALAREVVAAGVLLVQVPRVGGATGLLCADCGHVARCARCGGGVRPDRQGQARCRLCHEPLAKCPSCGADEFLPVGAGSRRSAEELQQAFASVPVIRSDAESGVLDEVELERGIVVATPGAEPDLPGGYAGLLILDSAVLLALPELRAREEAVRRWLAAVAKTAPGAPTLIVAAQDAAVVQALVRNDPGAFAEGERQQRQEAHMPPAYRCVRLRGASADLRDWLAQYRGEVLGPLDSTTDSVALLLAPHQRSAGMLAEVRRIQAQRSRAGAPVVEARVDPADLGAG